MTIHNFTYTSRFARIKKANDGQFILTANSISYAENSRVFYPTRDTLPAYFTFSGHIFWNNCKNEYHSTCGPAKMSINGSMRFMIHDRDCTMFEIMMV